MSTSITYPLGAALLALSLAACAAPVSAEPTPGAPVLGIDLGGAPGPASPAMQPHHHAPAIRPQGNLVVAHAGHARTQASGTVNAIDAAKHTVNVSHGPIPALGWPAMRMEFEVAPSIDLQALQPGMQINFTIEHAEGDRYIIQSISPAGGGR